MPVLIGAFAVSQIFKDIINMIQNHLQVSVKKEGLLLSFNDIKKILLTFFRSSIIGTWVGSITRNWC